MSHLVSPWILPPTTVNALAKLYRHTERLLRDETATYDVYCKTLLRYARFIEEASVFKQGTADRFQHVTTRLAPREVKALLHRVNCQVMQVLALKRICESPCCCHCPAAYDNIACLRAVFEQLNWPNATPTIN